MKQAHRKELEQKDLELEKMAKEAQAELHESKKKHSHDMKKL